jgi:hypothetical protein
VLPVSTVLHQQLTRLGLAADDIALLAGDTGSATTVVVGRGDGQILLVRTLPGNWNDGAERLAVDLNRTTQFVNQQYGLTLNRGIWLFGAGADNHAETIQRLTDLPVSASPVEAEPFYWATAAVKLGSAKHPNFLAAEQREAPQRRVFARAIAAITGTVVLLSLLATGAIIFWARQEGANLATLEKRVAALQSQCGQLREHNAELAAQEKVARLIVDEQNQPVPGWFVAYMSQALPTELMISKMHLKQVGELWQVQLEGNYHPVTALTGLPTTFTKSLAQLTDRLANGPFHLKLLPKDAAPNFVTSENHFTIEGVMR